MGEVIVPTPVELPSYLATPAGEGHRLDLRRGVQDQTCGSQLK